MNTWFSTDVGRAFLSQTGNGKFAFIWKAKYVDGTEVKQFDSSLFESLLADSTPTEIDLEQVRSSVDRLDVRKVKELILLPTAFSKAMLPHIQPARLIVNVEAGEKFISYWLVDFEPETGTRFYRHVIGISKPVNGAQAKFFAILNPIGQVTVATSDDQSFDGE